VWLAVQCRRRKVGLGTCSIKRTRRRMMLSRGDRFRSGKHSSLDVRLGRPRHHRSREVALVIRHVERTRCPGLLYDDEDECVCVCTRCEDGSLCGWIFANSLSPNSLRAPNVPVVACLMCSPGILASCDDWDAGLVAAWCICCLSEDPAS
jgi:hypothetical protein